MFFISCTDLIVESALLSIVFGDNDDSSSREEIIECVTNHQSLLQDLVDNSDFWIMSKAERYEAVKEQPGDETIVKGVYQPMARQDVLVFDCGGSGISVSASTYTEFYYSAGNLLYAPLSDTCGDKLTEIESGRYERKDDLYAVHIEKIADGWFYSYQ